MRNVLIHIYFILSPIKHHVCVIKSGKIMAKKSLRLAKKREKEFTMPTREEEWNKIDDLGYINSDSSFASLRPSSGINDFIKEFVIINNIY